MILSQELRNEYNTLFRLSTTRPDKVGIVENLVDNFVLKYMGKFQVVQARTGIPWVLAALIQSMESGENFSRHPHNGDPLTGRTFHVPANRPVKGNPPFTWEESFSDLVTWKGYDQWKDWSVAGILYILEGNNGWGYRNYGINTPYLWSFDAHAYTRGKYVADGKYDPNAVSAQCGAAVLLRRLLERGVVSIAADSVKQINAEDVLTAYYDMHFMDPDHTRSMELQATLNAVPGVWLKVDGILGPKSATAFHVATGRYLLDDPMCPNKGA